MKDLQLKQYNIKQYLFKDYYRGYRDFVDNKNILLFKALTVALHFV